MVAMQVPLKMANSPQDSLQLSFSRCVELLSLIQTLARIRDRVLISFRCLRHHCSHAFRLPTCLEQKDSVKILGSAATSRSQVGLDSCAGVLASIIPNKMCVLLGQFVVLLAQWQPFKVDSGNSNWLPGKECTSCRSCGCLKSQTAAVLSEIWACVYNCKNVACREDFIIFSSGSFGLVSRPAIWYLWSTCATCFR